MLNSSLVTRYQVQGRAHRSCSFPKLCKQDLPCVFVLCWYIRPYGRLTSCLTYHRDHICCYSTQWASCVGFVQVSCSQTLWDHWQPQLQKRRDRYLIFDVRPVCLINSYPLTVSYTGPCGSCGRNVMPVATWAWERNDRPVCMRENVQLFGHQSATQGPWSLSTAGETVPPGGRPRA